MIIRKLTTQDLPTRVAWMNDPRVYSSMHFDVPVRMDKTEEWFARISKDEHRFDAVFTDEVGGGKILAFGGITGIIRDASKAETYLFVSPECQHQGIGSRAKLLLCEYAFTQLRLNKLYVVTNEDNHASIALQKKFGYQLEGRLREEYALPDGSRKDRLYFGLLKKEFMKRE